MKLITLSGLDGSGKSTQIEMLKDYLKSQDKTFFYFHAVEFSIAKKFEVGSRVSRGPTSNDKKSVTKATWLQIQLRKIALVIDIFRFKRMVKMKNVDYFISDRYFYDSVVNINYLSGKNRHRLVECFIPRPDKAFFIKVSPEKIMQRERKPDQGMEYLVAKEKLFEKKIKDWDLIVLDGEKNKEEIHRQVISNL